MLKRRYDILQDVCNFSGFIGSECQAWETITAEVPFVSGCECLYHATLDKEFLLTYPTEILQSITNSTSLTATDILNEVWDEANNAIRVTFDNTGTRPTLCNDLTYPNHVITTLTGEANKMNIIEVSTGTVLYLNNDVSYSAVTHLGINVSHDGEQVYH